MNTTIKQIERADFLLRWARVNGALPKYYVTLVLDKLKQKGVHNISATQIQLCKNDGAYHVSILEAFEEIARTWHPDRIRDDKQARKFLKGWERRPGQKSQAALLAAA